jgi:hypothetical protein
VLLVALAALGYIVRILVGLFQEANMAFGMSRPEVQGIERRLTARDMLHPAPDSVLTPRQISTVLSIAEQVMNLPDGPDLGQRAGDVLVASLNAASMTLIEYRYIRGVIASALQPRASSDSIVVDRLSAVMPRFQAVRHFFDGHRDSIALTPSN